MNTHTLPALIAAGPFRTSTAVDAGLTPRQLQGRRFARLFRDVYAPRELALDPWVRARGALLLAPHAVVGRTTAARLWSLTVPDPPPGLLEPVHLLVPPGTPAPRRAGLVIHEVAVPAGDVADLEGLPVAVPARVLLDCAPSWALGDLVALGDEAVRRGLLREDDLAERVREGAGRRGIGTARDVMTLLDPESPCAADSRVRVLLICSGIPRPRHLGPGVLGWPEFHVRVDVTGAGGSPADLVLRTWDLLRAHGWPSGRPRPLLHEGLAAIGAFRGPTPSWGYPA